MAKTNKYGYFCDYPCGFSNPHCKLFFCQGCASAGMPLKPNTEYPEIKRHPVPANDQLNCHNNTKGDSTS